MIKIKINHSGSICAIGLRVSLPIIRGVGSHSLSLLHAWANSCTVIETTNTIANCRYIIISIFIVSILVVWWVVAIWFYSYSRLVSHELSSILISPNTRANHTTLQNPLVLKPSNHLSANKIIQILIIQLVRPSVSIFRGNVMSLRIGPSVALSSHTTNATAIAAPYPSIVTHGTNRSTISKITHIISRLMINFFMIQNYK